MRAVARFGFGEIARRRILTEAGAVAFFLLLAIPSGASAFVALYGLVADPASMRRHVDMLVSVVPAAAIGVVEDQLDRFADAARSELGWSFATALGLSLLSASAAMRALVDSLNAIARTTETRGFLRLVAITTLFTLAGELFLLASVGTMVAVPLAARLLGLDAHLPAAVLAARWPVMLGLAAVAMTVTLRYGPCRARPPWRRAAVAGSAAAACWIAMSMVFDAVFARVAGGASGSLGTLVAFMTWLWISVSILLICARFAAPRTPD